MTIAVMLPLLLAGMGLYALAMSRVAMQVPAGQQAWRTACFTLGLVIVLAAMLPSPDLLGPDHRFAVNMAQFGLAVEIGPLLLLLGLPAAMFHSLARWDSLGRRLTAPLVAGVVSSVVILGWHVPLMFEAASRDLAIWIFKEITLTIAGFWAWWPLAGPVQAWRSTYPGQLIYLAATRPPVAILTIVTLSGRMIYTSRSFASELCAPSTLADQQDGGVVMLLTAAVVTAATFIVLFANWASSNQVQAQAPDEVNS